MIVLPDIVMRELMTRIVGATHSLCDEIGNPVTLPTIPDQALRMAAIVALQIVTGEPVWPGDKKIIIRSRRRDFGIFKEED